MYRSTSAGWNRTVRAPSLMPGRSPRRNAFRTVFGCWPVRAATPAGVRSSERAKGTASHSDAYASLGGVPTGLPCQAVASSPAWPSVLSNGRGGSPAVRPTRNMDRARVPGDMSGPRGFAASRCAYVRQAATHKLHRACWHSERGNARPSRPHQGEPMSPPSRAAFSCRSEGKTCE